ncbi:MAG TPA: hypothetical protein PK006_00320 [Saprospiraceae bacterium]|nr:hypothetical protein [Saprospiraceae bacterium]
MISVADFQKIMDQFSDSPATVDKAIFKIEKENEVLMDILLGTHAEFLSDDEMDFLVLCFLSFYMAYTKEYQIKTFEENEISDVEESTWGRLNQLKNVDKALDLYYDELEEKDSIEFVGLLVMEIEDEEAKEMVLSDVAKQIFVTVLISSCILLSSSPKLDLKK